ncbi:MAG: hypothetical protein ABIO37_04865 [Caulobacteraceae bacterium]
MTRLHWTARLAACVAALTVATPLFVSAAPADFNGVWSGDQGVLWDTSVKPGQPPNAPFTPEFAAQYQDSLAAAKAGRPKADPPAQCLPPGVPRIMASPFPFEFVVTPKVVYILYEYMSQVRRIYMDGEAPRSMGLPTFNGRSTGKWDGDTLVVETIELNPLSVLDTTHLPVSEALKSVERMRLTGPDKMEVQITLIDPKAYTRPWTTIRTYTRKPGEQILQYVCEENNRNPLNADGTTGFVGPK